MNIRQHFQEIKKAFFPQWDRENVWRVTTRSRREVHGYCDPDTKTIHLVIQHTDPDEKDALCIHEICHAVASCGHGKVWQTRMETAAKRADALGKDRLASILREQVVGYQDSPFGLQNIYASVEDALMQNPDLTLSQIKEWISRDYGFLVSEVGVKLKRIEKVYRKAQREGRQFRTSRELLRKKFAAT